MAIQARLVVEARDQRTGLSIEEFLEFAHLLEQDVKIGKLTKNDLLLGSIGFSAQIKRLSVIPKSSDKGKWNVA